MGMREKVAEALEDRIWKPGHDWSDLSAHKNHRYDGTCGICRGDTGKIADAVMEVVDARDAAVRELHQPYTVTDNPMDLCRTCDTIHPCATLRALGEDT